MQIAPSVLSNGRDKHAIISEPDLKRLGPMSKQIVSLLAHLSLAQRFTFASLVILASGMIGIGAWVAQKIEEGVVDRTGATTALYVDSAVAPLLQELAQGETLKAENLASLNTLLHDSPLGQQIVIFKVWNSQGKVLYSTDQAEVGQSFPVEKGLADALKGNVAAKITDLQEKEENAPERQPGLRLLEIYSPVRLRGTNSIISVMEFYQNIADLQGEIASAQRDSWLIFGVVTLTMYLLLALFVKRTSDTIGRQQNQLSTQMTQLLELHERVRRAASRTAALNERVLRRISAELHDGPVQELALAIFQLDDLNAECPTCKQSGVIENSTLPAVANSLRHALQEVRAISTGLGVPELQKLSLQEALNRAVRTHERRTKTQVAVELGRLPGDVPLSIKITIYRVVQEALNNAYRHAAGVGQRVRFERVGEQLVLEVSDQGPGSANAIQDGEETHLGVIGMRERVESLGGSFTVESQPGRGTKVIASLPIHASEVTL